MTIQDTTTTPITQPTSQISPPSKPTPQILLPLSPTIPFLLSSESALSLTATLNLPSLPSLLPLLVPRASPLSRPPISNFPVSAAALGSSGRVFLGVNLEFPGVPLHHSVHAEQFLVANAALHREPRLLFLAVSHVPCGHCRQFLQELRGSPDLQILVTSDPTPSFRPLSALLPEPFGPRDLLPLHAPLLLDDSPNPISLLPDDRHVDPPPSPVILALMEKALEGARRAHAPYSRCPAGFAVADEDGVVYGGGPYIESAAYNPSLGPVQAGLIAYVAGGGGEYRRIVAAALVEGEGAAVSHEATARTLLEKVAPLCLLRVYRCCAVEGN